MFYTFIVKMATETKVPEEELERVFKPKGMRHSTPALLFLFLLCYILFSVKDKAHRCSHRDEAGTVTPKPRQHPQDMSHQQGRQMQHLLILNITSKHLKQTNLDNLDHHSVLHPIPQLCFVSPGIDNSR